MHAPPAPRGVVPTAALLAALLALTAPSGASARVRGPFAGWRGVPPVSGILRERGPRFAIGRRARAFLPRRRFARLRGVGYGGRLGRYGYPAGGYGYGYGYRYGAGGFYGGPGAAYGTTATQLVYGPGPGGAYLSERPLAVRFVEPPLAPSPYAPYDPSDRYADAAGAVPARRLARLRYAPPPCTCGGIPGLLPYGIGTAY